MTLSRRAAFSFLSLLVLSVAATAHRGFCGDDVDGVRVPCDCGDVIASDTTLQSDDPIGTRRCPMDGLTVRAERNGRTNLRVETP
jgi:hypothetical protein